jgi:tRNA nucleotidyltransferase (CCA-adding enzyme)
MSEYCPHCAYPLYIYFTHCTFCGRDLEGEHVFICQGREPELQTLLQHLKEVQTHHSFQSIGLYGIGGIGISTVLQAFKMKHIESFDPLDLLCIHPFITELPLESEDSDKIITGSILLLKRLLQSLFTIDLNVSLSEQKQKYRRFCHLWSISYELMLELEIILGYEEVDIEGEASLKVSAQENESQINVQIPHESSYHVEVSKDVEPVSVQQDSDNQIETIYDDLHLSDLHFKKELLNEIPEDSPTINLKVRPEALDFLPEVTTALYASHMIEDIPGAEPLVSLSIPPSIQPDNLVSIHPEELLETLVHHNLPGYTQNPNTLDVLSDVLSVDASINKVGHHEIKSDHDTSLNSETHTDDLINKVSLDFEQLKSAEHVEKQRLELQRLELQVDRAIQQDKVIQQEVEVPHQKTLEKEKTEDYSFSFNFDPDPDPVKKSNNNQLINEHNEYSSNETHNETHAQEVDITPPKLTHDKKSTHNYEQDLPHLGKEYIHENLSVDFIGDLPVSILNEAPDLMNQDEVAQVLVDIVQDRFVTSNHDVLPDLKPNSSYSHITDSLIPANLSSNQIFSLLEISSLTSTNTEHSPNLYVPALKALKGESYVEYAIQKVADLLSHRAQDRIQVLLWFDLFMVSSYGNECIQKLMDKLEPHAIYCILERPSFFLEQSITFQPLIFEDLNTLLKFYRPNLIQPLTHAEEIMKYSRGLPALMIDMIHALEDHALKSQDTPAREKEQIESNSFSYSFEDFLKFASIIGPTFTLTHIMIVERCLSNERWNDHTALHQEWQLHLQQAQEMNLITQTKNPRFLNELSYRFHRDDDQHYYAYSWHQEVEHSQKIKLHQYLAESLHLSEQHPDALIQNALTVADHWIQAGMKLQGAQIQFEVAQQFVQKGNLKWACSTLQQVIEFLEDSTPWKLWSATHQLYAKLSSQIGDLKSAEHSYHLLLQRAWNLNILSVVRQTAVTLQNLYEHHDFKNQAQHIADYLIQIPKSDFDPLNAFIEDQSIYSNLAVKTSIQEHNPLINIPLKGHLFPMNEINNLEPPPDTIMSVLTHLQQQGYEAWIVGGSVRDRLLGRSVNDWDITSNATPEEVQACFDKVIPTGIDHGTVTVIVNDFHVEVTTYRIDGTYNDGRRPNEIYFTRSLHEDLARRDLTINAMAWDPVAQILEDPFEGQLDLQKGTIKAVGSAQERFNEDGLRPLRAIRFASTLGFEIEANTQDGIRQSLDVFRKVAMERVQVEFFKILLSDHATWGIHMLRDFSYLSEFMPELSSIKEEVWPKILTAIKNAPKQLLPRLSLLFHACDEPILVSKTSLKRLNCATRLIQDIQHLLQHRHVNPLTPRTDAQLRALTAQIQLRYIESYWQYRMAWAHNQNAIESHGNAVKSHGNVVESHGNELQSWQSIWKKLDTLAVDQGPQSTRDLALSGHEVCQLLHLKPSKIVGQVLHALLTYVWENPTHNTAEDLSRQAFSIADDLELIVPQ